jgi:hypothetical protein
MHKPYPVSNVIRFFARNLFDKPLNVPRFCAHTYVLCYQVPTVGQRIFIRLTNQVAIYMAHTTLPCMPYHNKYFTMGK